jgi:catechol 2,3-dioxygenase-like lactoylglutathione lyase family enzyme
MRTTSLDCRRGSCLVAVLCVWTSVALQAAEEEKPQSITQAPWREAVVSVTDLDRTARFFREIGGYQLRWRGAMDHGEIASWGLGKDARGEAMLLAPPGAETGLLRLLHFDDAGRKEPTRPGARAWDTGCYFSLMVRMKGMQSIYDDAVAMGWWTETPITYLEFGRSKLNVMIFKGPDGIQVQGYERLEPPLPPGIPEFERLTQPFNMMQMVRDRDAAYDFFTRVLGFDTFYKGKPYVDEEPTFMPLGIPVNLTTSIPYRAGIVYPVKGEFGRMEMIEIMGLDGHDHAGRCDAPNLGILSVRFPVDNARQARDLIQQRNWSLSQEIRRAKIPPYGAVDIFAVKSPDGAIVQFFESIE